MSGFYRLIIVLMLVWILLLVIHPAIDLPQTVLRSNQLVLMLVMWSAVVAVSALQGLWPGRVMLRQLTAHQFSTCRSTLDKTCLQRC